MQSAFKNSKVFLYLAAILYGLSFWGGTVFDPDLGWHLLGGSWILSHGKIPVDDIVNSFNFVWVDYHWLGQIVLYKIYSLGGYPLLLLGLGLTIAYLSKVLLDIIFIVRGDKDSIVISLSLYFFSITLISEVTAVRPQVIAFLFIAISLRRLLQAPNKLELPLLSLLAILLVNIHVYWIFIPFLWILFRCVPFIQRHKYSPWYVWGGLSILGFSGFISPYGFFGPSQELPGGIFTNYTLIIDYIYGSNELKNYLSELMSGLSVQGPVPWLLYAYAGFALWGIRSKRLFAKLPEAILAVILFFMAVRTLKFVSLFGVCGLPFLARSPSVRSLSKGCQRLLRDREWIAPSITALITCFFLVNSMPFIHEVHDDSPVTDTLDACRAIAHLNAPIGEGHKDLRVLTHFDYGGWCRWGIYQEDPTLDARVTSDGRTQFVPFEHFILALNLFNLQLDWQDTLKRWSPDVALVERHNPLFRYMSQTPSAWKVGYQNKRFVVFEPVRNS